MVCQVLLDANLSLQVVVLVDKPQVAAEAKQMFPNIGYIPCNGSYSTFLFQATNFALRYKPSLILIGHPHYATIGWFLAKLANAHLVTFIYGIDVWQPLPPLRRFGLSHSNRIISISHFTSHKAIQTNGLQPAIIRILYNCVDPQFVKEHMTVPHPSKPSILTVGRITTSEFYKGHNYVIKAMPALLKQFPNLTYNIVGDGNGRAALESLAAEIGVTHAVRFHGTVSDAELRHQYENASLFIMPSRNEGFGFVFIEAMVQAIPAIGGNIDATPEVIVNGETGYLINPFSVDEIVGAISCILSDPDRRQRMGHAAMKHVKENFSFAQFEKTLLKYLAEFENIAL